jgi:hypothetical protein
MIFYPPLPIFFPLGPCCNCSAFMDIVFWKKYGKRGN